MEAIVIGAALFAALLVTFGVLRARVREVSRAVEALRVRVDALAAETAAAAAPAAPSPGPAPAPAAPSAVQPAPIDVEAFVD